MPEPDIEIFYALHGGEPVKIGSGSFEDFGRLSAEADVLNANMDPQTNTVVSPGSRHIIEGMGETGGVKFVAELALDDYEQRVKTAKEAVRQSLFDQGTL